MNGDVNLRRMVPEDVAEVLRLRTQTRENRVTSARLAELGITQESVVEILKRTARGWLGEDSSGILGFVMANGETGEILVLALLPCAEGQGLGRQLMQTAQAWLFERGHPELWLMENPDPSIRAYGFYRKLGWQATGKIYDGEQKLVLKSGSRDNPDR